MWLIPQPDSKCPQQPNTKHTAKLKHLEVVVPKGSRQQLLAQEQKATKQSSPKKPAKRREMV